MEFLIDKITRLSNHDGESNVCKSIEFRAIKSETIGSGDDAITYNADYKGKIELDLSDMSSFVAFDKVDEDIVKSWIESSLGQSKLDKIESNLDSIIELKKNPPEIEGFPW